MTTAQVTTEAIVLQLRSLLADMLGVEVDDVDADAPLTSLGIDSKSVVELLAAVEALVGREVEVELFLDGATLAEVGERVGRLCDPHASPAHDWAAVGYAAPSEPTARRRLLDDILSGDDVPAAYITRFGLPFGVPCTATWEPGRFSGEFRPPDDCVVFREMVFGGYAACVVDQFAGLASFTVMTDDTILVTEKLEVDYKRPFRVAGTRIDAVVSRVEPRQLVADVEVRQGDVVVCRGRAVEVILPRPRRS